MGPAMSAVVILLALTIFPPHSDFSVFMRFGEGDCIGEACLVEPGLARRKSFPDFVTVRAIGHFIYLGFCGVLRVQDGRWRAGGATRGSF